MRFDRNYDVMNEIYALYDQQFYLIGKNVSCCKYEIPVHFCRSCNHWFFCNAKINPKTRAYLNGNPSLTCALPNYFIDQVISDVCEIQCGVASKLKCSKCRLVVKPPSPNFVHIQESHFILDPFTCVLGYGHNYGLWMVNATKMQSPGYIKF